MIAKVDEDTYIYHSMEYGPVGVRIIYQEYVCQWTYQGPKKSIPIELSEEIIYSLPDELKPNVYYFSGWFDHSKKELRSCIFATTLVNKMDNKADKTFLFLDIKDLTNGCTG